MLRPEQRPAVPPLLPYTTLFRSPSAGTAKWLTGLSSLSTDMTDAMGGNNQDRKSTRLNSSHRTSSYAVFCLKKKRKRQDSARCRGGPAGRGAARVHDEGGRLGR